MHVWVRERSGRNRKKSREVICSFQGVWKHHLIIICTSKGRTIYITALNHHRNRNCLYRSHPNQHHHVVSSMCVMCFIIVSLCSCVLCPSRVLCSVSSMCHQHSWALATWRQEGTHQSAQLQILFSRSYKCSSLLSQHHTNVLLNFLQILFSRS